MKIGDYVRAIEETRFFRGREDYLMRVGDTGTIISENEKGVFVLDVPPDVARGKNAPYEYFIYGPIEKSHLEVLPFADES